MSSIDLWISVFLVTWSIARGHHYDKKKQNKTNHNKKQKSGQLLPGTESSVASLVSAIFQIDFQKKQRQMANQQENKITKLLGPDYIILKLIFTSNLSLLTIIIRININYSSLIV